MCQRAKMTISVDRSLHGEGRESGASKLCTFLVVAAAVVCVASLVISIWPGWLNDLIAAALLLTLVASPFMVVAFIVVGFVLECSPISDPRVMRVSTAQEGRGETRCRSDGSGIVPSRL